MLPVNRLVVPRLTAFSKSLCVKSLCAFLLPDQTQSFSSVLSGPFPPPFSLILPPSFPIQAPSPLLPLSPLFTSPFIPLNVTPRKL